MEVRALIDESKLLCSKCGVTLELLDVKFSYLGHEFKHKIRKCPKCGQVFIPESLAEGKISEVETLLEDK